jgi:HK97 gp10 family phage protein
VPKLAFVTGDKEVDKVLANFEPKWQKKHGRRAARDAAKFALADFKNLAPEDTGAMVAAAKVKAAKRSRKFAFGSLIHIDRDKMFAHRKAEGERVALDKKRGGEPFFYPSVIEFGDSDTEAQKPLRTALYGNETEIKRVFMDSLRAAIRETKP